MFPSYLAPETSTSRSSINSGRKLNLHPDLQALQDQQLLMHSAIYLLQDKHLLLHPDLQQH